MSGARSTGARSAGASTAGAGAAGTAVVTGASSGIGRAVAVRLLADGWRVVGLSRRDPGLEGLDWRPCDLSDPAAPAAVTADLASVRALVHAAGFQESGTLADLDPESGRRMYDVHVGAATTLAHALVDRLDDGGRIVLVGSRTAAGVAGKSLYAASKAALRGLARSWAQELAPRRVTVNVVEPGPTRTAMLQDPRRSATPVAVPPLGRLVEPEEVAALVAHLLGPDGAMVTGQHWQVCGGASL
ncbi:SDR family oxidoreductase [Phycicoccus sp. M110.8]|uniref:SDR family NAD(P)-dependent oxidoreductase n=1 Tax=Phycicoccus sp. M110.8 TaxID=3075433 RepID=UPI0028FD51E9|nr:SDR family oxidoreductase [Phycicoccus sp. M110.8]MDU0313641.1 SDR family oxidoreductase [Phycicoccus sp. M110.8]